MNEIINNIRLELMANSDEKTKAGSQRFFKEETECYGVKSATVGKIGKEYFKTVRGKPKNEIFNYCEEFWQSGILEETFIACNWSYFVHNSYEPNDLKVFEKWINTYIKNWASCDTFCNHTVGEFIEMYPEYINVLKLWAKSTNRWMRRAAAVSLIVPAKKGKFIDDIFKIADIMLLDKDDMVQKGYGWMLKVACQKHLEKVFNYVMKHKAVMPRTALRYAIEKMPQEMKKQAMEK